MRASRRLNAGMNNMTQTVRQPMSKAKIGVGGLALVSVLYTLWSMQDTYNSNHEREEQEANMNQVKKDYSFAQFNRDHLGGQDKMEGLAKNYKAWCLYGPYGIKEKYEEATLKVHSIWKEVIMPNLVPLGISIASVYAFFGPKAINSKFAYAGKKIGGVIFNAKMGSGLAHYANKGFHKTIDGLARLFELAIKHPIPATGLTLLGAWFLYRFDSVYSGDAQREYFRHELWEKDGLEE
jgi:hypothetical protein